MNILVTGSEGGIGKPLVRMLLQAGHSLRTFDIHARPPASDREHFPGDIRELSAVRRAVQGVEAVLHLGAIPYDFYDEEVVFTTNVQGTWNILLACKEAGVGRLVFFSSINALGRVGGHPELTLPVTDDLPHRPRIPYGLSKHLGEEMCKAFGGDTLKIASLRPTLVIQPEGSAHDFYKRWRTRTDHAADLERHRCDLWSYVDVRDVCYAAMLSLAAPIKAYDAFLLAADDTMMDVPTADLIAQHSAPVCWHGTSPEDYLAETPFRSLIDCSHAKNVLGWQPQFSWRVSG